MKKIKISLILVLVSLMMFLTTGCQEVMSSNEYQLQIQNAKEYFSLPEFPNMELIEVTKHLFFPVYIVSTPEEFNNIRKYKDRSYFINNDIDLSSIENFEPIGSEDDPFVGEISSSCIIASKGSMGVINKGFRECTKNNSNDSYKVISNINIKITDDNYTKYVGVFGYAGESNIDYFIEAQKELNPGYLQDYHINSINFIRDTTDTLIFDNVNIEVNSIKETIVGGVFGRGVRTRNSFIVNSIIKGNYVVGSFMGQKDYNYYDNRFEMSSYFNNVIIEPIKHGGLIGGVYGKYEDDLNRTPFGKYFNYNNLKVIQNEYSKSVIAGGIAADTIFQISSMCNTNEFIGVTFTDFDTSDANKGLLFGNVHLLKKENQSSYCTIDSNNYGNVLNLENYYAIFSNSEIRYFYEIYVENDEEIIINDYPKTINPIIEEINNIKNTHDDEIFWIDGYDYPIATGIGISGSTKKRAEIIKKLLTKTYYEIKK
jgi:hypothetical protein